MVNVSFDLNSDGQRIVRRKEYLQLLNSGIKDAQAQALAWFVGGVKDNVPVNFFKSKETMNDYYEFMAREDKFFFKDEAKKAATNNPKELEGMKKTAMHNMPRWPALQHHIVHNLGAQKYGHFNWRKEGVDVNTYLSAARRHIDEFLEGLEQNQQNNWQGMATADSSIFTDDESQAHVLAHACACLYIMMDAQYHGKLIDNYSTPEVKPKTSGKPSNVTQE